MEAEKAKQLYTKIALEALKAYLPGELRDLQKFAVAYSCSKPEHVVKVVSSGIADYWTTSPGLLRRMSKAAIESMLIEDITQPIESVGRELGLQQPEITKLLAQTYNPIAQRYGLRTMSERGGLEPLKPKPKLK